MSCCGRGVARPRQLRGRTRVRSAKVHPERLSPHERIRCGRCDLTVPRVEIKIHCAGCDQFVHCGEVRTCPCDECTVGGHRLRWCADCAPGHGPLA